MPDVRVLPCTLALFGALGDLALRKLFPALYQLDRENLLHRDTRVLALARDEGAPAEHLATLEQRLRLAVPAKEWDDAVWQRFRERLDYLSMDFLDPQAYVGLREAVDDELPLVAYFATPASVFGGICENLAAAGLAERTRVVLEKPIGHDLESSREVNEAVARFFPESRIYRIDHYLGKETVQNLIALRFANSLFETQWNQNHISHVEITVAEKVGIEGRWGYFDQAGQLRDMVQNHLLQLLCLIAMDPPSDLSADSIRDEGQGAPRPRADSRRTTGFARGAWAVHRRFQRRQGSAGLPGGGTCESRQRRGNLRRPARGHPQLALVGRAVLPAHRQAHAAEAVADRHPLQGAAALHLRSRAAFADQQPADHPPAAGRRYLPASDDQDQGLGKGMQLRTGPLQLSFSETYHAARIPDAYERLLLEVTQGNQYLFVRKDEVEFAWKWCDQLIAGWERLSEAPKPYPAGSWGPVASVALVARDGRSWYGDF